MSEDIPERLGRYQVLRRLGTGGMAEVFLAKSLGAEGIEKVLVVKRVLPTFARSTKFSTMFVDEAKVAMRLNHPNIVQVYAFEQVGPEFLLAMEFVDGPDLGRLLAAARRQATPLPFGLCAFIAQEIAKGLHYAHSRRDELGEPMEIVHRDVSPQNVLLAHDGVVKIADFGIARARLVSEEIGVIKGKFSYMSPEQARGERVAATSDVYSMGILLSEMLMNRVMYPGQQGLDILERVRAGDAPSPSRVRPDIPRALESIVRRATAPSAADRYPSARKLAGALTQYLHTEEEVWDAEALERYLQQMLPREQTSPESHRHVRTFAGGATLHSVPGAQEVRERRRVVVVAGRVTGRTSFVLFAQRAGKMLEDITFKSDAVLDTSELQSTGRFRITIGLGQASVTDPLKATHLAIDIVEAIDGLNEDSLVPLSLSIGLSRGMVGAVRDPHGRLLRASPMGTLMSVADALADAGREGDIYASGEVYRLVRRDFAFDEEQSCDVSIADDTSTQTMSVRAWLLRGIRSLHDRAESLDLVDIALVGRDEELRVIGQCYSEVLETRRTQILAVTGALGMGKTSLIRTALERLEPTPLIVSTECGFGSADEPYQVASQLLRSAVGATDREAPSEIYERVAVLLEDSGISDDERETLLAALAPLIGMTPDAERDVGDQTGLIRRAFESIIKQLSRRQPVVLWIDALQWADSASLDLVAALRLELYRSRALGVLSSRDDGNGHLPPRVEAALRGVPRLVVRPLPPMAIRSLVEARFRATVSEDVLSPIETRSGGNPFFTLELVDSLIERNAVRFETSPDGLLQVLRNPNVPIVLPTTLEGAVAARLDELPEAGRNALRWLATAGSGLPLAAIAEVAGPDFLDAVQDLHHRELVAVDGSGAVTFPSGVIRQVSYETAAPEDRVRMHRRLAAVLQAQGGDQAHGRIARHLEQAGERNKAAYCYLDAGNAALQIYSNRDALRFFGKALELLPPDDRDGRFRAHDGREQIYRLTGATTERERELEALRAIAEKGKNEENKATSFLRRARFALDRSDLDSLNVLVPLALQSARSCGNRKLELDALKLEIERERDRGAPGRGLDACQLALDLASDSQEHLAARADILVQKGILLRRLGRTDEALAAYAEAIVIFRRLRLRRGESVALNSLGVALIATGLYEDAITAFRASIHLDRETGDRLRLGRKLGNVGQLYGALGDTERGLAFVRRALAVFEYVDDRPGLCDALISLAELSLDESLSTEPAGAALDRARKVGETLGSIYGFVRERIVRARVERIAGRIPVAERNAREALEAAQAQHFASYETLALVELASALAVGGQDHEAISLARKARERLAAVDVDAPEQVAFSLALTMQVLGAVEEANDLFQDAKALLDQKAAQIRDPHLRELFVESPRSLRILEVACSGTEGTI